MFHVMKYIYSAGQHDKWEVNISSLKSCEMVKKSHTIVPMEGLIGICNVIISCSHQNEERSNDVELMTFMNSMFMTEIIVIFSGFKL